MDAIFAEPQKDGVFAGASVVVVQNGEVVFAKGYGIANPQGRPFTPTTRSYLGSVSKSFVGLAMVRLVRAGQVRLDDTVISYLPNFKVSEGDVGLVTLHHLLTHTSGFTTYTGNRNQTDTDQFADGLERTVSELADWPLTYPPGTRFEYSNANYQVLGRVIEVVTDKSFADAMEELVFAPLMMSDTRISHDFSHRDAADGFRFWGGMLAAHQDPMGIGLMPQGGVSTTAENMGNYLVALSGGNGDIPNFWGDAIARGSHLEEEGENYAAGWAVSGKGEELTLTHHGLNGGFTAAAALKPQQGVGVAVIMNTGDGFFAGDVTYLQNQALHAVIPKVVARKIDFTPRYLQAAGLCALVVGILFWIVVAARRGISAKHFVLRLTLPTAALLGLSYAIGVWLPAQFGIPLAGIGVFYPDVGLLLTLTAGLALVWAVLRCVLLVSVRLK